MSMIYIYGVLKLDTVFVCEHSLHRASACLPFCLNLVRAPLTVPGHSGTPVIEAKLREGQEGTDGEHRRVWT